MQRPVRGNYSVWVWSLGPGTGSGKGGYGAVGTCVSLMGKVTKKKKRGRKGKKTGMKRKVKIEEGRNTEEEEEEEREEEERGEEEEVPQLGALSHPFLAGFPTKRLRKKVGSLVPSSLLEDLGLEVEMKSSRENFQ